MKIKVKYKNNEAIGYNIIAETENEKRTLGTVRNLHFWGFDDTELEYDGIESEQLENDKHFVNSLKFIQKKHK
jgi:hypothetical protein